MSIAAIAVGVAGLGLSAYQMSQAGKSQTIPQTSQGAQSAQMALDQYNTYVKDFKPEEMSYIADVVKPTKVAENQQIGKANADIEQKMAIQPGDPNRILRDPTKFTNAANYQQAVDNNVVQGVKNQQIQEEQGLVNTGLGKAGNAISSMDSLAADAQSKAIGEQQAKNNTQGAIINSAGSALGAIGGIAKNWPVTPNTGAKVMPVQDISVEPVGYTAPEFT